MKSLPFAFLTMAPPQLGFFSYPEEFEWITNIEAPKKLASILALSIVDWFNLSQK
ncbi:MAG: hypothetical protein IGS39_00685 [Calothrix sp. C42_A2020_038]|nr:hypothetical protein [Calothrix sp. C42_A2020_038]